MRLPTRPPRPRGSLRGERQRVARRAAIGGALWRARRDERRRVHIVGSCQLFHWRAASTFKPRPAPRPLPDRPPAGSDKAEAGSPVAGSPIEARNWRRPRIFLESVERESARAQQNTMQPRD